ncbi:MAG: hypothetical protein ACFE7E_08660 [Candidatus Hodarchaeota archaeon]
MAVDVLLSVLINSIPIIVAILPYILLRSKPTFRKLYARLLLCFIFFWAFYYILPGLLYDFLFLQNDPSYTTHSLFEVQSLADMGQMASYFLVMTVELMSNIFSFIAVSWPFIFVGAPLLSVGILIIRLRKEDGSFREKLGNLSFDYRMNPIQRMKKRILTTTWREEKEFLKLLIVLLPLTLYILTGIINIVGVTENPITTSQTNLGWFIEVFLVYLTLPLIAVYILYSSNTSYEGRPVGERTKESTFQNLMAVGLVLSMLSVILFIQQASITPGLGFLSTVLYFVSYYTMLSITFIAFLPLFEAIASFILVKICSSLKPKMGDFQTPVTSRKLTYTIAFSIMMFGFSFVFNFLISSGWLAVTGGISNLDPWLLVGGTPTMSEQLFLSGNIIISAIFLIGGLVLWGFISGWLSRLLPSSFVLTVLISYFLTIMIGVIGLGIPFFIMPAETYWITPSPSLIDTPTFSLFTVRTALLRIATGGVLAFDIIATPFNILKSLLAITFFAFVFHYWKNPFKIRKEILDSQVTEAVYSEFPEYPSESEVLAAKNGFLFDLREDIALLSPKKDTARTYKLIRKTPHTFGQLLSKTKVPAERLYDILSELYKYKVLGISSSEFSFTYYRATLQALYIVTHDGRNVFSYSFIETATEPTLVAGMLSAISSFVKETTRSRDLLRTIDHGDTTLLVEYGSHIFAALLADRETAELRLKLRDLVGGFEEEYSSVLHSWDGDISTFQKEAQRVKQLFAE